jgi:hypothetical protein
VNVPKSITVLEDRHSTSVPSAYRSPLQRADSSLVLERRWLDGQFWLLTFVGIALFGCVVAYVAKNDIHDPSIIFSAALGLLVLLVLVYPTLVGFLNRTTLAIRDGVLNVRHGPLPWALDVALDVSSIVRVWHAEENSETDHYELLAQLREGGIIKLIIKLPTENEARFLAHAVSDHLRRIQ